MAIPGNLLSPTTEAVAPNTSGWRVRTNCATSLGSGGRNGDGLLTLTATAAGEMQAETVTAYPITAGDTWYTLADAASATQPERIGISWLDDTLNPVGAITWSLTTSSSWSTLHRIAVAGVAPVGATRARIVLSATVVSGGDTHFFENVYFGRPIRTPGNLLSFNAEAGGELNLDGWAAETNCTLAREVPAFSWSVDFFLGGGHMVTATADAGGDTAIECTERPPATPGTEYLGYVYLGPPDGTADTWAELRFRDSGGTLLAASRAYLDQDAAGSFRQRLSAVAPAGAATVTLAAGMDAATTGQAFRIDGAVIQADPVVATGSVVPYEDATFEQGVGDWAVISGAATIARSSPWGAYAVDGSYSMTVTSAAAATSTLRSTRLDLGGNRGGQSWRTQLHVNVTAGSWTIRRRVRWYDAGGIELGTSSGSTVPVPEPDWWYLVNSLTVPAGAVEAEIEYELAALEASSTLQIDRVALWESLPLTAAEADDGTASVTLTLRELTPGNTISVWRVAVDGSRTLVRGPDGLYERTPVTSDLLLIEDYEVPLGQAVTYRTEMYDSDGALAGYRTTDAVSITPGDINLAWLKDPGNPQRNTRVMVQTGPAWTRPVAQSEHRIRGRRNSVVLSDVRGGLQGDLAVWTRSDEERARLHWLLDSGNVLLWQAAPGMGVDDMYVAVGDAGEDRIGGTAREPWRTWTLPLTQVDMPTAVGIAGTAGRTWADVLAEFTTWEDVLTAYSTWEDVLFDRRKGDA